MKQSTCEFLGTLLVTLAAAAIVGVLLALLAYGK